MGGLLIQVWLYDTVGIEDKIKHEVAMGVSLAAIQTFPQKVYHRPEPVESNGSWL